MKTLRAFWNDESGEDLIEYGLLAAFVASIALVVLISDPLSLKRSIRRTYQIAADALDGAEGLRTP